MTARYYLLFLVFQSLLNLNLAAPRGTMDKLLWLFYRHVCGPQFSERLTRLGGKRFKRCWDREERGILNMQGKVGSTFM